MHVIHGVDVPDALWTRLYDDEATHLNGGGIVRRRVGVEEHARDDRIDGRARSLPWMRFVRTLPLALTVSTSLCRRRISGRVRT